MKGRRWAALSMGGVMAVSILAGCGGVNQSAEAATLDDETITLGIANFSARFMQANYDDFYTAYFGEDVWSSDLSGNGTTAQESIKESVMDSLEEMYILKAHMDEYGVSLSDEDTAAISEAASAFLSANSKAAVNAMGATQEIVEEYLSLQTISSRMHAAIIADADTEVSDEEAKTSSYSYVHVSTSYTDDDGNSADYEGDELSELTATFGNFVTAAKDEGLETAAEEYGYSVSEGTFTADDEDLDEDLLTALEGLGEGELSDAITLDDGYYVVRLDAEVDEEATEENRASIIEERQDDYYDEILDGWKEEHTWTVNEKNWATVTFDNLFTTVEETEETEDTSTEEAPAEDTSTEVSSVEEVSAGTEAE